jgi:hypothetical protein
MPPRTDQADQQGDGQQQQKGITSLLDSMALARARQPRTKDSKDKYAFWEGQPVMQFNEEAKVSSDAAAAVQSATRASLQPNQHLAWLLEQYACGFYIHACGNMLNLAHRHSLLGCLPQWCKRPMVR